MTSTLLGTALVAASTTIPSSIVLTILSTSTFAAPSPSASMNGAHRPPPSHPPPGPPPPDNGNCHLLGPFAILVQGALGALALLSLVYKRWRERPQRPVKIWAFDVSKQVFGTLLLHMANLLMSMFSAGEIEAELAKAAAKTVGADDDWKPNPCSFYLLNLAIDTTLGIPILLLMLKLLTVGASKTALARPPESIMSGNYGNPPRVSWWVKQTLIYFVGLMAMKTCVFFIFQLCPWIVVVGDWALKWTEGNTALQIAFVMLIFPLIMNAFQYYVVDTFIKKKPEDDDGAAHEAHAASEGERGGLLAGDEHARDHGDSMDEDTAYKVSAHDAIDAKLLTIPDDAEGGASSGSSTTVAEREAEAASVQLPKNYANS